MPCCFISLCCKKQMKVKFWKENFHCVHCCVTNHFLRFLFLSCRQCCLWAELCLWALPRYSCSLGSCRFLGAGGGIKRRICSGRGSCSPALQRGGDSIRCGSATEMLLREWKVMGIFSENPLPFVAQFWSTNSECGLLLSGDFCVQTSHTPIWENRERPGRKSSACPISDC